MDGVIVNVADMTEQPLPGIKELSGLFPDITPDDNRPDPYIVPVKWLENNVLRVSFSWRVKEYEDNENDRIYGEYEYNANTQEYKLMSGTGIRYPDIYEMPVE